MPYTPCRTVTCPDDARRICAEIEFTTENPLVINAGGDGTVNAMVNALSLGRATLAVLPLGTANVLILELGISPVADGIARIAGGSTRPLAVGLIEGERWGERAQPTLSPDGLHRPG